MATKSTALAKAKPPKNIVDREIEDREHDELVNWLIMHRAELVSYQFAYSSRTRSNEAKAAAAEWAKVWDLAIEKAKRLCEDETKSLSDAAKVVLARADKWRATVKIPPIAPEFGTATIKSWTAQEQIYTKVSGKAEPKKTVAFVDAVFEIVRKESPRLSSSGWSTHFWSDPDNHEDFYWEYWAATIESSPDGLREFSATRFSNPTWQCRDRLYHVYYDVRAKLPTLGETLQSLKTLQSYVEPYDICLFAKEIPEFWREVLRNEGFLALSQQEVLKSMGK